MEQMIDVCVPFMKEKGMKEDEAIALMKNCLPNLKRWRKEDIITKIVEKDKMIIVGKEVRTTNKDGAFMAVIPKLWEEFENKRLGDEILNKVNKDEILGLYTDYENKEFGLYSFMVGFQVTDKNSIPKGMTYKVIPATNIV